MIMTGVEFMGEVPFETVYLHGIVRHEDGTKISKSDYRPGDDPLEVIEQYGADALRFYLATSSTPGNDLRLSLERIEGSRNFANKLWNAARFVLSQGEPPASEGSLSLADRWIRSRVERTIAEATRLMEEYSFGEAGRALYGFVWDEFCDWYIEIAKLALRSGDESRRAAAHATLFYVLERALLLLHPYIPYVTEEIWSYLPDAVRRERDMLMTAAWPTPGQVDAEAEARMRTVTEVVQAIRTARAEQRVEAGRKIEALLAAGRSLGLLQEQAAVVRALAGVGDLRIEATVTNPPEPALRLLAGEVGIYLPLAGMVDLAAERRRIASELEAARAQRQRVEQLLANPGFTARARPEVVERERARLTETGERVATLEQQLAGLGG
jgi:valyl-tRNA synthetase